MKQTAKSHDVSVNGVGMIVFAGGEVIWEEMQSVFFFTVCHVENIYPLNILESEEILQIQQHIHMLHLHCSPSTNEAKAKVKFRS